MSSLSQRLILFLATGCGSGYVPVMPGTAGSVVGIILFLVLYPLSLPLYVLTTLAFIFLAIWASDAALSIYRIKALKINDPSQIVIDEIAGYLVTMISFPPQWLYVMCGFILFRVMDIIKPYPANIIDDKTHGGAGIVLDDIVAGIYANIMLQVIRLFF
jgi:phosphatidylglycerophosphatase A